MSVVRGNMRSSEVIASSNSFPSHVHRVTGVSPPHSHQSISPVSVQISRRYPGDGHQRNDSWQPTTGHTVRGMLGTHEKQRNRRPFCYYYYYFKELRSVFCFIFHLSTATSGGNSFEVRQPRAALSSRPEREEKCCTQWKNMEGSTLAHGLASRH